MDPSLPGETRKARRIVRKPDAADTSRPLFPSRNRAARLKNCNAPLAFQFNGSIEKPPQLIFGSARSTSSRSCRGGDGNRDPAQFSNGVHSGKSDRAPAILADLNRDELRARLPRNYIAPLSALPLGLRVRRSDAWGRQV